MEHTKGISYLILCIGERSVSASQTLLLQHQKYFTDIYVMKRVMKRYKSEKRSFFPGSERNFGIVESQTR
jgi:hypothetical protein